MVIMVTGVISDVGLFIPRDGWSMSKLFISLIIGICGSFICFGIEILQLKKSERSIVLRLKGGVLNAKRKGIANNLKKCL